MTPLIERASCGYSPRLALGAALTATRQPSGVASLNAVIAYLFANHALAYS